MILASTLLWTGLVILVLAYVAKEAVQWWLMGRTLFWKARTGAEGMVGGSAVVVRPFARKGGAGAWEGKVRIQGEIWNARLEKGQAPPPLEGERVTVTRVQGLLLHVAPGGEDPW